MDSSSLFTSPLISQSSSLGRRYKGEYRSTLCLGALQVSPARASQPWGSNPVRTENLAFVCLPSMSWQNIAETVYPIHSMGLPYMPIRWGVFWGQCRHIWQSHGVYGYQKKHECGQPLPHEVHNFKKHRVFNTNPPGGPQLTPHTALAGSWMIM